MKVIFEHQSSPSGLGFLVKEYVQTFFTSPYHFHDLYELIWIKKSYGKLYAGKNILNFKEGDVFFFSPGFGHCFYNEKTFIEQGEKAHAIAIFFKADLIGQNLLENSDFLKIKDLFEKSTFGIQIDQGVDKIIKLFTNTNQQRGMDQYISFLQILNELAGLPLSSLNLINQTVSTIKPSNKESSRLEPVLKYVIENFRDQLDSKTAANLIHLNDAAFCRFFKRRMEQTFSQFVNKVRITHATNLLFETEWDILRICYECGFNNLSYFNRQFRDIIGMSPKEYRNTFHHNEEQLMIENQID